MRLRSFVLLTLLPLSGCAAGVRQADPEFLVQYAETFRFSRGWPRSIKITPNGDAVLYLRSGPRDAVQNLYEFNPVTGQERVLLTAETILQGDAEELSAEELARRERMRSTARGIASYSLSKDGRRILVSLSGGLYVIDRAGGAVRELPDDGGFPLDARFSPDGRYVACVRDGDLYVIEVDSGAQTRLTHRPGEHISYGLSEFIAQEEMGRFAGYWWSPDSRRIAYQATDTSMLETMHIADAMRPDIPPQIWPYPRPGRDNADVRLGVMDVTGGDTIWIDWDRKAYEYLATVRWQENAPLTLVIQNRYQTELVILTADDETGQTQVAHVEKDPAWINLEQDMPHWVPGRGTFLWATERYGDWVLEERTPGVEEAIIVAPNGPANYRGFFSLSEDGQQLAILVDRPTESKPHPTQRHLAFLERDRSTGEWTEPKTNESAPPGIESATFAPDHKLSIRRFTTASDEGAYTLYDAAGSLLGELPSTAEQPPFKPNVELVTLKLDREYEAAIIRPRNFSPLAKYPVVESVYGGPGHPVVSVASSRYVLDQWIADHGFIVVRIDGRGTPGKGRSWERAIKGNLIYEPLNDHVAALKALGRRCPQMDMNRVGIYGWSFGGYFSAMAVMQHPDVYQAGVAGAPVCDWMDYDTHYTERYLSLPADNPGGYQYSSVLQYADELRRPLLLIHGTTDDNVYFTHSLKISEALFRSGIHHEFLPLSNFTHMVADPTVTVRLNTAIVGFLQRNLSGN